jgi:hypothetical protein
MTEETAVAAATEGHFGHDVRVPHFFWLAVQWIRASRGVRR